MAVRVGTRVTDERVLRGSNTQQGVLQATELKYFAFHTCVIERVSVPVAARSKATATLEAEPTQHNTTVWTDSR
jgi:hypothetical protein